MTKWEYGCEAYDGKAELGSVLNTFGRDGWELCGMQSFGRMIVDGQPRDNVSVLIFKRPKGE